MIVVKDRHRTFRTMFDYPPRQAIEASTQSPLEHVRKPAEQLLKACEEIPGYTSVLALIAGTRGADADARVAAVILLKNMVRIRWRSRGGGGFVVGEGEKAVLKGFLLEAMDEPEEKVASQVNELRAFSSQCASVIEFVPVFGWESFMLM